ncbi:hypothetical protein ABZZ36_09790 [Actinacidiphila glaucinigra]|uniref:hypothetical protein n=1 Tax=Actinacidiphila glaucinigra TaxID=235986 RepID=UPI0033A089B7
MTTDREQLISALERLGSRSAESARAALREGAGFRFFIGSGVPANHHLRVFRVRERILSKRAPASERHQWVSDALPAFSAAGDAALRLGEIRHGDGRHFFLYMTSDLGRCVACL